VHQNLAFAYVKGDMIPRISEYVRDKFFPSFGFEYFEMNIVNTLMALAFFLKILMA